MNSISMNNPSLSRRYGLALLWICFMTVFGQAGQPVEPPRNPFANEAWELPAESTSVSASLAESLRNNCLLCHSYDYVTTQPPLTLAQWTATVEKMRSKFGAVIGTNQVPLLAKALADSTRK